MAYRFPLWTSSLALASVFLQLACGGTETADSGSGGQPGSGGAASGGQVGSGGSGGLGTGGAATGGAASGGAGTGGAASGGTSASGGSDGSGGGAGAACPQQAPEDGTESCVGRVANCFYEDCDGVGQVTASCDGAVYRTESIPCEDFSCGAETCTPGQICTVNAGGAFIGTCTDNPCGDGPVTCECGHSTCSGTCSVFGAPGYGIELTCNTCPNGQACP